MPHVRDLQGTAWLATGGAGTLGTEFASLSSVSPYHQILQGQRLIVISRDLDFTLVSQLGDRKST